MNVLNETGSLYDKRTRQKRQVVYMHERTKQNRQVVYMRERTKRDR